MKKGEKIEKYKPSAESETSNKAKGKKIGIADQLENGDIVYIPE